jgi:hypothetical protein
MSKFDALSKTGKAAGAPKPTTRTGKQQTSGTTTPKSETLINQKSESTQTTHTLTRMGRPPGKRSNEAYRQVTAWVRKDTYNEVSAALVLKHDRKEFSELVQELLAGWLKNQR